MKWLQSTNGLTANYNNYSAQALEAALQSWVEPYPKPIILNHDLNSEPIGRVMAAKMDKEEDGSSFVRLQVAITDPVAIQKVLDKRYLTGSVGGRAGKAVCSITGEDLAAESSDGKPKLAKFKRGQVYKGKLAFVDMQDISFKEYSFVNQPADSKSGVRKSSKGDVKVENSTDDWVAKSSAFVLSMNEEDIYSVEEHKSILKDLKSKESKPLYLHLKGAFLTAYAVQESENYNYTNDSLLSNENREKDILEEKLNMNDEVKNEDILATVEELSQDLSDVSAANADEASDSIVDKEENSTEEVSSKDEGNTSEEDVNLNLISALTSALKAATEADDKTLIDVITSKIEDLKKEQAPVIDAASETTEEASKEDAKGSEEVLDSKEEQVDTVDSSDATTSEEIEKTEESETDLTGTVKADEQASEQDVDDVAKKLQSLEEENQKLKNALHRTLVERVVDAKIANGLESYEVREELIADHSKRTASSLADSLRDLATMPVAKTKHASMPEINPEIAVENEENVIFSDKQEEEVEETKVNTVEQLFVDAFMGRRKL